MTNAPDYAEIRAKLMRALPAEDAQEIHGISSDIIRNVRVIERKTGGPRLPIYNLNDAIIAKALESKNFLEMCGGGKDSLMGLSVIRAAQLELLERYGKTFTLHVGIGRQPGMIDVGGNLDRAFKALGIENDPLVKVFYIDGRKTSPYVPNAPIPEEVVAQGRNDVLMNGHLFGGAGRRTFCDHCNLQELSGWIATGLAHSGADMYTTGDSPKEIAAQIHGDVLRIIEQLGGTLPAKGDLSDTQHAFSQLEELRRLRTGIVQEASESGNHVIDYAAIPRHCRQVTVFPPLKHACKGRLEFLEKFLGFDFGSIMFSFTESDCGNPSIMCHLYGLVAEHIYGSKGFAYSDGVRAYCDDIGFKVMEDKEFDPVLVEIMKQRYEGEDKIRQSRADAEIIAKRAYHLEPEHLVAMIYSPFTEKGRNLDKYLSHLVASKKPDAWKLKAAESQIRKFLVNHAPLDDDILSALHNATGLMPSQMQQLSTHNLEFDNFDLNHGRNKPGSLLPILTEPMYSHMLTFHAANGATVLHPGHGR
jgi:hypothetical protein